MTIALLRARCHVVAGRGESRHRDPDVGGGTGGCALFFGRGNPSLRVMGNRGPIVFVGVGGGGAGASTGGSGFAGNDRNDNGGGGRDGAGAPILGYQFATATGDVLRVLIGSGGPGPTSGGSRGTPGTAGGNGLSSVVRRVNGANLVVFPGGRESAAVSEARSNLRSRQAAHRCQAEPTAAMAPRSRGSVATAVCPLSSGGAPAKLQSEEPQARTTEEEAARGGSALCIGGNGHNGGSSQGSAGSPGSNGQFGSGDEGGGNGGDGLVIMFWGDQACAFPTATDGPSLGRGVGCGRVFCARSAPQHMQVYWKVTVPRFESSNGGGKTWAQGRWSKRPGGYSGRRNHHFKFQPSLSNLGRCQHATTA